jgi:hypothetical protein
VSFKIWVDDGFATAKMTKRDCTSSDEMKTEMETVPFHEKLEANRSTDGVPFFLLSSGTALLFGLPCRLLGRKILVSFHQIIQD